MLRPFFPELVMSTDLLSFEHPSVLLFCSLSQTPRGEPHYRLHTAKGISVNYKEQDKSSDIDQQPPFATANKAIHSLKGGGGGLQNQREHHIILTKYEAVSHYVAFNACFFGGDFTANECSSDISNWFELLRTSDSRESYVRRCLGKFPVNQDLPYSLCCTVYSRIR